MSSTESVVTSAFDRVVAHWGFDATPGAWSTARLPVGRRASGQELTVTGHLCVGTGPGPVLAVLCGTHGDESYGVEWSRRLIESSRDWTFRGGLLCIPVANVLAFETGTRTTGQGMNTDNTNLNRVFPGNADGALNDQLAAVLTAGVLANCDALIDVHTGGVETVVDYVLVESGSTELDEAGLAMSRAFGSRYLFASEGPAYPGTATGTARALGVPSTVAEFGGSAHTDPEHLSRTVAGVHRVMARVGMCEAAPDGPAEQIMLHRRIIQRVHTGGFFLPSRELADLGATVDEGTVLGRVYHPETFEMLEVITAPYPTTVLLLLRLLPGRINMGEFVAMVADRDSGRLLDPRRATPPGGPA